MAHTVRRESVDFAMYGDVGRDPSRGVFEVQRWILKGLQPFEGILLVADGARMGDGAFDDGVAVGLEVVAEIVVFCV